MRVLILCEESQTECLAFRAQGDEAYSCDLQPCSGGHPEWHIQDDCFHVLDNDCAWDLVIAHPPCTFLSAAGACRLFHHGELVQSRYEQGLFARSFFLRFFDYPLPRLAVENPRPLSIYGLPKSDQVIQPYYFGEPFSKETHLWLRGLPPLFYTLFCPVHSSWVMSTRSQKIRSKSFPGIAAAMAAQWRF